jgi:hypothetical protein
MFIYFLQSKGFIKGHAPAQDYKYLQNELKRSHERGANRYYSAFLDALFFEGFAKPETARGEQAVKLIGGVPYLNGGLFLKHGIESRWTKISVPDVAFENLFRLFESFSWNLNDTPGGKADEINPDVLGYILRNTSTRRRSVHTTHALRLRSISASRRSINSSSTASTLTLCRPQMRRTRASFSQSRITTFRRAPVRFDGGTAAQSGCVLLPEIAARHSAGFEAARSGVRFGRVSGGGDEDADEHLRGGHRQDRILGDAGLKQWLAKLRKEHPSINYYIKKRIITDNLFGVDIMEEATEIAKLRLFSRSSLRWKRRSSSSLCRTLISIS